MNKMMLLNYVICGIGISLISSILLLFFGVFSKFNISDPRLMNDLPSRICFITAIFSSIATIVITIVILVYGTLTI